jgi:hypothetical protein
VLAYPYIETVLKTTGLALALNNHLIGQGESESELKEKLISFYTKLQSELTPEFLTSLNLGDLSMLANYINLSGEGKFTNSLCIDNHIQSKHNILKF